MKLWLLDADIIIDLLSMGVFDSLVKNHEIHVVSAVIGEVKYFWRSGKKISADFRKNYVDQNLIKEVNATMDDVKVLLQKLPPIWRSTIHSGEIESIAVLIKHPDLIFCTCDAATIKTLPIIDLSDRGISVEAMLRQSGLGNPKKLLERHTEKHFRDNLNKGKEEKIYYVLKDGHT